MKPLIMIGRGGHALSCLDVIRTIGLYEVLGYVDVESGETWNDLPCLGTDASLAELMKTCPNFFIGIGQMGSPSIRRKVVTQLRSLGAKFPTIISPKAHVAVGTQIGEGTIVMHAAHVGPAAQVGSFNILNTRSLIEHGCKTGEFVHVATAAVVNGDVTLGDDVFIGSNSSLCQGINVPPGSFVQAGEFIGRKHVW